MTITGLLLAGGQSTRMGRDKATLVIHATPLWARQLALLRALEPQALVISARQAPAWAPSDVLVIPDRPPSRGPLSGIAAALARLNTSHLLALAIDLPRMTGEHLQYLVSLATASTGVIPQNQNHFEPLAAVYPKQAAPLAERALNSGDASLQSFARKLFQVGLAQPYVLSVHERALYQNLNTPDELSAWQAGA